MHDELIIMTKFPTPGQVKTRLIGPLTADQAADLYGRCIRLTIEAARGLGDSAVQVVAAIAPDDADFSTLVQPEVQIRFQGGGDLGARLDRMVSESFASGARRMIVIGCDCPDLQPEGLRKAFEALDADDSAVIGPAADGGYYLLGLCRPVPRVFDGIDWSTDRVFSQTLSRLSEASRRIHTLPMLSDLDEIDDLFRFANLSPSWNCAAELQAHIRVLIGKG